jgi:hypothetical protein
MWRLSGGMVAAPRFGLDEEEACEFISLRRLWRRVRLLKKRSRTHRKRQGDICRAFEYIDGSRGCVFNVKASKASEFTGPNLIRKEIRCAGHRESVALPSH